MILFANSEVLDRVYLSLSNKKISFLEFLDWYSNPSLAVDYKVTKNTASFEVSGDEISVVSDTVKVLTGRGNIYSSSTFLRINGVLYKAPINIESQKSIIDDRIYTIFYDCNNKGIVSSLSGEEEYYGMCILKENVYEK